jgi:ribonuclease HI
MYILQFDGMYQRSIPETQYWEGILGYGWLITKNGVEIAHGFGLFAHRRTASSSMAEYLALIEGLDALVDLRVENEVIEVRGDAKCVIDQMQGSSSVSSIPLRKLHRHACKLARNFHLLNWFWVPRQKNRQADQLSRRGLRYLGSTTLPLHHMGRAQSAIYPLVNLRVHSPASLTIQSR